MASDRDLIKQNRVWNDGTWFWQDPDRDTWSGLYSEDTDNPDTGWSEEDLAAYIKNTWGPDYWDTLLDDITGTVNKNLGLGGEESETSGWYADQATALAEGQYSSYDDWLTGNDMTQGDWSEYQAGMQTMIDALSDPDETWGDEASAYAAKLLGFEDDEAFDAAKSAAQKRLEGENAIDNYAGLSAADRALYERQNRRNLAEAERRAQRLVQNTMAGTGSMARMLNTADEATRSISNMQIQQDVALAAEETERQLANMQAEMAMYDRYVQTGSMGYMDYLGMQTAAANSAIQGYMNQITAVQQQNAQYLDQFSADQNAINNQIEAMLGIGDYWAGLEIKAQDLIQQKYNSYQQMVQDSIQAIILANELDPNVLMQFLEAGTVIADIVGTIAGAV